MTELDDLKKRISQISINDWQKLFDLLPEIEESASFGEIKGGERVFEGLSTMPYVQSSKLVDDFFNITNNLGIVPVFNWTNWDEGKEILQNKGFNYSELSVETLCKLFTVIIRNDRFCDGYMVSCFENGIISKILVNLKNHIESN